MQNNFDRLLKNKIKNSFNEHKEPFIDDDWLKMKEKLNQEKKKKAVFFILFGKVASIALLVAITALISYRIGKNNLTNNIKIAQKYSIKNTNSDLKIAKYKNLIETYAENYKEQELVTDESDFEVKENSIIEKIEEQLQIAENESQIVENQQENYNDVIVNQPNDSLVIVENVIDQDCVFIQNKTPLKKDSLIAQNPFHEDDFNLPEKNNQKFNIGVAMSSMSSFSNSVSPNSLNFGGGVESSYSITKNFAIKSGIIISRQSLAIGNSNFDFFSNELVENTYNTTTNSISEPNLTHTYVTVDIPLNIQFKVKKLLLTTGFSSLAYAYEKNEFTYDEEFFNYQTNKYELNTRTNSDENYFPTENNLDLAKIINFSVGYKIPLKKGSFVIEPYIKYPIGDITPQNLRFSTAGISLQYNFLK